MMSWRPLVGLGLISYGYLGHEAIVVIVNGYVLGEAPSLGSSVDAGVTMLALLLTLACAWLN